MIKNERMPRFYADLANMKLASKITSPTLVICGDSDPYLNYDLVMGSVGHLPEGSRLEVIEGGSHVVYIEKPYYHLFRDKIMDFLSPIPL